MRIRIFTKLQTRAAVFVAEYVVTITSCIEAKMRILLIHNPKAGERNHDKKQLIASLIERGHKTFYQSTKKRGWKKAFDKSVDLVIAAGGDGTVRKTAWRLMDTDVPLAILPLGTANNLARSLGFTASPDKIMAHLGQGTVQPFDIGVARGAFGKKFFVEAAGGGLLADFVKGAEHTDDEEAPKKQRIRQHVSSLRKISAQYPPRQWNISIDGEDVSGSYLLWEAMNIRAAGPGLNLAPRAASDDGVLDFVSVREQERTLFEKYLDAQLAGNAHPFPFPARKVRELQIAERAGSMHFDGKVWQKKRDKRKSSGPVEISVRPAALMISGPAPMRS
ncbi:MAG TPA: diacylglycerol kinase family protein [Candidatus Udaeobacter sp.]|jgi:diacylglycerol kinase family enzyme|nr:diacylglycerol kinase family protein [Candidatus Udaeobacter sp.]